jgi:hypothetical protein
MTMTKQPLDAPVTSPPQVIPDCTDDMCPIHDFRNQVRDWWPQKILADHPRGAYWQFYVRFNGGNGRHHDWLICEKHHKFFLRMMETEYAWDVAVMEASDRWMSNQGI